MSCVFHFNLHIGFYHKRELGGVCVFSRMSSRKSLEDQESKLKSHLKQKIAGHVLPIHETERQQLKSLVAECVEFGTSNSILLLGLPGQGTSFLVNSVLEDFNEKISVVSLSGLLHTNDHLALKHIIQQLHIDVLEEDKVTGSFFDNLAFVLESLKSSNRDEDKPLIIVLDQLEYFTHHKNQTLLYNLFDVVQSHQTAICVIAITKRIDVLELLEKRVKSRFSPSEIFIVNSIPYDLSALKASTKSRYADEWNASLKNLAASNTVKSAFQTLSAHSKSVRLYKQFMLCLLDRISPSHRFLTEEDFKGTLSLFIPNEKVDILMNLSMLELCLVIACSHHSDIYDRESFNFEMVYKRFRQFCSQASSLSSITRHVVMRAFQRLESLGIIKCFSPKSQRDLQFYNLLYLCDEVIDGVKAYPNINTEVMQWATSNPVC